MIWGKEKRLCILYALTPVHAGSGQALRAVDLPIQRERHTGIPIVQSSGIKGSIRDWCEKAWGSEGKDLADKIFGKAGETGSNWAGAVTLTDAKLLLFPVRSNVAPFVHITSPSVLKRFKDGMDLIGGHEIPEIVNLTDSEHYVPLIGNFDDDIILEDIIVKKASNSAYKTWGDKLREVFTDLINAKVILVTDEVFGYLTRMATEVQAHIAIEDETGTAKDGSLRYQEYLPSDSVLYFIAFFADVRAKDASGIKASEVARKITDDGVSSHIQIGGDFTLGKGICKVRWIKPSVGGRS